MTTRCTTRRPSAQADIDLTTDPADTSPPPFEDGPVGPLQTFRVSGVTFSEREVEVVVRDAFANFEGDLRLGPVPDQQAAAEPGEKAVVVTWTGVRWPNSVIPYVIDSSLAGNTNVTAAIAHWNSLTPIRMVARDPAVHPDFVVIKTTSDTSIGGASDIGHGPGQRSIVINASGSNTGTVIHEIGHTVGLWHQQSREDRDTYVTINLANVQGGTQAQFNQYIVDGDDSGPLRLRLDHALPPRCLRGSRGPGTPSRRSSPASPSGNARRSPAATSRPCSRCSPRTRCPARRSPKACGRPYARATSSSCSDRTAYSTGNRRPGITASGPTTPSLGGGEDPLPGQPTTQGTWATVQAGQQLTVVPYGGRVLDWQPATGQYRVWRTPDAARHSTPGTGSARQRTRCAGWHVRVLVVDASMADLESPVVASVSRVLDRVDGSDVEIDVPPRPPGARWEL